MANTVTVFEDAVEGANSAVYADLAFSGTYATGGETLTPSTEGLTRIAHGIDGADHTAVTVSVRVLGA